MGPPPSRRAAPGWRSTARPPASSSVASRPGPRPTSIGRSRRRGPRSATGAGRGSALADRVGDLNRLADLCDANADELARIETLQTGTAYKLRRESDFAFASDNLRFFAGQIRHLEGKAGLRVQRQPHVVRAARADRRRRPGRAVELPVLDGDLEGRSGAGGRQLGRPQAGQRDAADDDPPGRARRARPGVPAGVLNVVTGRGDVVGAAMAAHGDVDLISLTGDSETGKRIQALAAGNVKRVHLELGGKAPFIVHGDADLEAAARGATAGALINGGQDCTAATRAYVHRSVYDAFLARTAELFDAVRVGDPFDPSTDLGTLISQAQVERVDGFVRRAEAAGARVVDGRLPAGRRRASPNGAFYRPTIVADCAQDSEIVQNEVFGPVLAVLPFDTDEEALEQGQRHAATAWPPRSGPATCSGRWRRRAGSTSATSRSTTT